MRARKRNNGFVVGQDVIFGKSKLVIKDVQELSFDTTNVSSSEDTRTYGPVAVLHCCITHILEGKHERAKEDTFIRPFFQSY